MCPEGRRPWTVSADFLSGCASGLPYVILKKGKAFKYPKIEKIEQDTLLLIRLERGFGSVFEEKG